MRRAPRDGTDSQLELSSRDYFYPFLFFFLNVIIFHSWQPLVILCQTYVINSHCLHSSPLRDCSTPGHLAFTLIILLDMYRKGNAFGTYPGQKPISSPPILLPPKHGNLFHDEMHRRAFLWKKGDTGRNLEFSSKKYR